MMCDYIYSLNWREGNADYSATGKRLKGRKSWSGLGKKDSDSNRKTAKIRNREVRLIDLERVMPARSWSASLYKKAKDAEKSRLSPDIEKAFAYIFGKQSVELYELAGYMNKKCYLICENNSEYSTFNAASGQEAAINLLVDIFETPNNSLILIDEVESGFHPTIQRRLADVIQQVSWHHKKQFIVTTHSPTLFASFPPKARVFLDYSDSKHVIINNIPIQAAESKMDSVRHPLLKLYVEDELARYLVKKTLKNCDINLANMVNIIVSDGAEGVRIDYERHKITFPSLINKLGYVAIFDGDIATDPGSQKIRQLAEDCDSFAAIMEPHNITPERLLLDAYLAENPNEQLKCDIAHRHHHEYFLAMVEQGIASSDTSAWDICYNSLCNSEQYEVFASLIVNLVERAVEYFSKLDTEY